MSKGLMAFVAFEQYKEIENFNNEEYDYEEIKPIVYGFVFDFVIFYPLIFLFNWFLQYCIYKYYKKLSIKK